MTVSMESCSTCEKRTVGKVMKGIYDFRYERGPDESGHLCDRGG